jgi:putative transcriptional regulator
MDKLNLKNHFLIAHDTEINNPFYRAVVYVCEHNADGAMGFVINRNAGIALDVIFESMEIQLTGSPLMHKPVLLGGPLQEATGFILHSKCQDWNSTISVSDKICVTTSKDILQDMVNQTGPTQLEMVLGYSGWAPGQLEQELQNNCWLSCPAQENIIFEIPIEQRWNAAIRSLGIDPSQLVSDVGHA